MQDRFKFRFWNGKNKSMSTFEFKDIIPMQCTSLKDKTASSFLRGIL